MGAAAAEGSEARVGMTGAIPSSVCERRPLVGLMSGVAVADDMAGTARGVAVAEGGVEAGTSGVAIADGRVDAGTSGVELADGRDASGAEGEAERGADDGRGIGVGMRAGLADGRGAGVDALGAGGGADAGAGDEVLGADAGAGVEGDAAVAVAVSLGNGAGLGSSSAPHSASISSVGGAMDGTGVLALTRSLSDRLSVIALHSAFHGPQHKSSAPVWGLPKMSRCPVLSGRFH
jgi:hypothetical protein